MKKKKWTPPMATIIYRCPVCGDEVTAYAGDGGWRNLALMSLIRHIYTHMDQEAPMPQMRNPAADVLDHNQDVPWGGDQW